MSLHFFLLETQRALAAGRTDVKKIYVLSSNNPGLDAVVSTIAIAYWFQNVKRDELYKILAVDGNDCVFIPVMDSATTTWNIKKEVVNFLEDIGIMTSDIIFKGPLAKGGHLYNAKYILVGDTGREEIDPKDVLYAINANTLFHPQHDERLVTTAAKVWSLITEFPWETKPNAAIARLLRSATLLNTGNLLNLVDHRSTEFQINFVLAMEKVERYPFFERLRIDKDDPTGLNALELLYQRVKFLNLGQHSNIKIAWPYLPMSSWVGFKFKINCPIFHFKLFNILFNIFYLFHRITCSNRVQWMPLPNLHRRTDYMQ